MSGHSHWATIKRKKEKEDKKKGMLFTKASQQIIIAVREGGPDPDQNLALKIAIDYAKSVNMPKDNIKRAIERASGAGGEAYKSIIYEGYGPGGVPMLVSTITENSNRTVNSLRHIFAEHGGSLGEKGAVMWQFKEVGLIITKLAKLKKAEKFGQPDTEEPISFEDAALEIMDVNGVEDIDQSKKDGSEVLKIITKPTSLAQVTQAISKLGYIIISSKKHFVPQSLTELSQDKIEQLKNLIDALDSDNDVQDVWVATKL